MPPSGKIAPDLIPPPSSLLQRYPNQVALASKSRGPRIRPGGAECSSNEDSENSSDGAEKRSSTGSKAIECQNQVRSALLGRGTLLVSVTSALAAEMSPDRRDTRT